MEVKLSEESVKALKEKQLSDKLFVSEETEAWYNLFMEFRELWDKTDDLIGKSVSGANVESTDPKACEAFAEVCAFLENCLCEQIKDHMGNLKNSNTL